MKLRSFLPVATCAIATIVASAAPLHAQGRAVRVVRPRSAIVVAASYRPYFYDPWFSFPYGWYPPLHGFQPGYYGGSSLRVQVTPREAEVFVDGYYAGTVDDFDGAFQRLRLEPGEHTIQIYLPGHRLFEQKIYLQPAGSFRVRHTMEPLASGEQAPARPSDAATESGSAPRAPFPRERERGAGVRAGGELSLRVQPGDADVTIDGEAWNAPANGERLVVQLAPGRHVVVVRKDGYTEFRTEVTILGDETTLLNVSLTAQP